MVFVISRNGPDSERLPTRCVIMQSSSLPILFDTFLSMQPHLLQSLVASRILHSVANALVSTFLCCNCYLNFWVIACILIPQQLFVDCHRQQRGVWTYVAREPERIQLHECASIDLPMYLSTRDNRSLNPSRFLLWMREIRHDSMSVRMNSWMSECLNEGLCKIVVKRWFCERVEFKASNGCRARRECRRACTTALAPKIRIQNIDCWWWFINEIDEDDDCKRCFGFRVSGLGVSGFGFCLFARGVGGASRNRLNG